MSEIGFFSETLLTHIVELKTFTFKKGTKKVHVAVSTPNRTIPLKLTKSSRRQRQVFPEASALKFHLSLRSL